MSLATSSLGGQFFASLVTRFEEEAQLHAKNGFSGMDRLQIYDKYDGFAVVRNRSPGKLSDAEGKRRDRILGQFLASIVPINQSVAIQGDLYFPVTAENIEDKRLKPMIITDVEATFPDKISLLIWRINKEIPINARLRATNLAISVVRGLGPGAEHNPFVKRLSWWVLKEHNGVVPVREERDELKVTKDTVASTRLQMLLNGALQYHFHELEKSARSRVRGLYLQIFDWMFLDPLTRIANFKAWITIINQTAFTLTKKGKFTGYGPVRHGVRFFSKSSIQVVNIEPSFSDDGYWALIRTDFERLMKEIVDYKLVYFANWAVKLVSAPFNLSVMSDLHVINSLLGLAGFTGTDVALSFLDNYEPDRPNVDRPFDGILFHEFKALLHRANDTNRFPTQKQFTVAVPTILTSKSSGVEKVSFTVKDTAQLGKRNVNDVVITGKSKALVGMIRPSSLHVTNVTPYTEEDPGTLASRTVVGSKDTRSVFALRVANFVWEWILQETMYRAMSERHDESNPLGNSSYSFNHQTGIADHIIEVIATSDPRSLGVFADYSSFDKSVFFHKRQILIDAYEEFCDEALMSGTFFGNDQLGFITDMRNYLSYMWSGQKREGAVFSYPYDKETRFLKVDQLLSGEFVTSLLGSFVNRAAFLSFMRRVEADMTPVARSVKLHYAEFLGDDIKSHFAMESPGDELALNPYLVMKFEEVATANQMEINIAKTMSRTLAGDYLRNRLYYGIFLPGAITQVLGSERGRDDEQVIEIMSGWLSIVQLNVQRGWDPERATEFVYSTWNLLRSIVIKGLNGAQIRYFLPFGLIWTPRSMGGIGFVHNGWLAASKDAHIYKLMKDIPEFDKIVRRSSYIVQTSKRQPLADALLKNIENGQVEPFDAIQAGIKYVNSTLDPVILQNLPSIRTRMASLGLPPVGKIAYDRVSTGLLEKAIRGTKEFKSLTTRDFVLRMKSAHEVASSGAPGLAPLPTAVQVFEKVDFALGDELEPWFEGPLPTNPFSMLRGYLSDTTTYYGLNLGENNVFKQVDTLSRKLRRSATLRRDVSVETILDIIAQPVYFGNVENISLFFMALGATETEATTLAIDFSNSSNAYTVFQSLKGTSFNDAILPMIDFSPANVSRIVKVPALPENVTKALQTYGMMISLGHFAQFGKARQVIVNIPDGEEINIIQTMFGIGLGVKDYMPSFLNSAHSFANLQTNDLYFGDL
jgi:hypothetical protein